MSRVRFHSMEAISELAEVKWWGIGWEGYNNNITVQENINNIGISPDIVVSYKPLEMKNVKDIKYPLCLRYNEMFDRKWTLNEIIESRADLIVCHHKNEMEYYQNYFNGDKKFVHIPHCAEKTIFKDYNLPKKIDLLLVGKIDENYPLRMKLKKILRKKKLSKRYNCVIFEHPGYILEDSKKDKYAIEFAKTINSAKISLTCSMIYRNRLAKYVEIPMCASALAADLPNQDHNEFKEFMIILDNKMKNKEIRKKLEFYLENPKEREALIKNGLKWSKNYTQEKYARLFVDIVKEFLKNFFNKTKVEF